MAEVNIKSKVDLNLTITLSLSMEEAKALKEIVAFGSKAFLEVFYKHLGKSTLLLQERGLISLFETIKETLPSSINTGNEIIRKVNELKK